MLPRGFVFYISYYFAFSVAWLLGGCWVGCWVAACGCCVGCFVVAAWVVAQAAVWLLCVAWQIGWAASPFELSNYRIIESSISRILDFSNPRSLDPLDLSNHRFLDPSISRPLESSIPRSLNLSPPGFFDFSTLLSSFPPCTIRCKYTNKFPYNHPFPP